MISTGQLSNIKSASVCQIYWGTAQHTYLKGSDFSKNEYNFVYFSNPLMASGEIIKQWKSQTHFPEIPSLPTLIKNKHYQIVVKVTCFPVNSLIYRINFFDQQGQVVKSINSTTNQIDFTFPGEANSYSFEMINGGCQELLFKRIQIAKGKLPLKCFDDFFVNQENNKQSDFHNLLLLADGKYSRKIVSPRFQGFSDLAIANISWQFQGDLTKRINKFIQTYRKNVIVFSTSSRLDSCLHKLRGSYPNLTFVLSKELDALSDDSNLLAHKNLQEEIYEPNLDLYLHEIQNYLRK